MAHYLQDFLNIAATLVAAMFLLVGVRGFLTGHRDTFRRPFFHLILAVIAVQVIGNVRVYAAIGRTVQLPGLGKLLLDCAGLVLAWALQSWVLHWTHPAEVARVKARRRSRLLAAALVLLATFFLLAPIDRETPLATFLEAYVGSPFMWCYTAVFVGYFGFIQVDLGRMSLRHMSIADTVPLRVGLGFLLAGSCFGVLTMFNKVVFIVGTQTGWALWWPHQILTRIAQAGAFYCIAIGIVCAMLVPRLRTWLGHYTSYRRLFPLWAALREAFPEIALEHQPTPLAVVLRPGSFRSSRLLYRIVRLVTEINDGRLRLRAYLDPASPLDLTSSRDAAIEAERIDAALAAHAKRGPRRTDAASRPEAGGTDLHSEISWLVRVSTAWAGLRSARTRLHV
jgi:hypothetical protein